MESIGVTKIGIARHIVPLDREVLWAYRND